MDQYYDNGHLNQIIQEAIVEDVGLGDITTESIVSHDLLGHGEMRAKEQGIVAGVAIAEKIFHFIDPELQFKRFITDGSVVDTNTIINAVDGSFGSILKAERTVLNIVQRMSGIATMTAKFVDAVRGTHAKITDTRKTAPGLRYLDKLSVKLGGGTNHRFGLDDMVLIKDNHIAAAGGISQAIELCLNYLHTKKYKIKIEVETKNLDEVKEVLKFEEIRRIMLDNYSIDEMKKAVEFISQRVEVEASGNVTLQNVRTVAETGVDFISVGALTHSPKALDISLKVIHLPKSS
ncbi:MAG: nicotinate-nucleotide diphosphorylase (carboxylating) [Chlorobiaceae bacterium]|nr:nicotinate-nucleotide diphosphorylase (carboxylating) [Chlorobiaceae bacterium]